MRIAFVTPLYYPARGGGTEQVVRQLAQGLAGRGHSCCVYSSDLMDGHWIAPFRGERAPVDAEQRSGVRVQRLRLAWPLTAVAHVARRGLDALGVPGFARLRLAAYGPWLTGLEAALRRGRFDVVHAGPFPYRLCRAASQACARLSVPFVLMPCLHRGAKGFNNPLLYETARAAALVWVFTPSEAEEFVREGVRRESILVLGPAIDPVPGRAGDESEWPGKTVVLFAGSKSRDKGVFDLLAAARRLADSKDIQFVAIGPPTAEWAAATQAGLPPNFSDRGFVSEGEKQRLFARCDVFALPSRVESFGLVYAEAWRNGKPVIGADIPAVRDVIRHDVDGLLSPFGDVEALTSVLRRLASDADLRRRLGRAGLERLRAGLSPAQYLDRLESAFRSVARRVQPASLPDTNRV